MLSLRVGSEADLVRTLAVLGVPVRWLGPEVVRPTPGVAYSAGEFARFPTPVARFPGVAQPGHAGVAGERAHVWVVGDRLEISVSDESDPYSVTEAAVAAAKRIEVVLPPIVAQVVDPPQDDRNCVCPRYYPEVWW
ncbi:hypothetical protein [Spongiactinospora sp. TRM90649]|uniref:hypothetical protein n=1 Tax=Spongiactinospora sp. TRM90649 TaxID=3031114 RepID=UPI0023F6586A|nr:hypothetical protein [Spongiactinospora sp. TRM90649]MDF5754730.1 hypothetical protein [Spongiactinospora sp. TRM90649]